MENKFVTATIQTLPRSPIKGIYYIGQYGTSGYASAARGYLYHYFSAGIPITWEPLYFDDSKLEDDDLYNVIVKSLIAKPISFYDVVIMHSTPDLWPKFRMEKESIMKGKIVIGYCAWETNRLPLEWVQCINMTVNEVWVPSEYNAKAFKKSGVVRQIRVVPHIFLQYPLPTKEQCRFVNLHNGDRIGHDDYYTFYSIGEMNARKGIDDLLKAFCETFTGDDKVRLVLKTHYKDYSEENVLRCEGMISEIMKNYENPPKVLCLTGNVPHKDILALHSIGDCYVSMTKSEGFGLPIFDAFKYGNKVIVTGYGGHLDFLGKDHPGLVNYKIGKVVGMEKNQYANDQEWAIPDIEHAKELMKSAV